MELGLQLQVLFLQFMDLIATGPGSSQLLLQHGFGFN
jgi:hypothetical protein